MTGIKSRVFEYGNDKESSWPPRFPKKGATRGRFYWDKETQKMVEGSPSREKRAVDLFTSDEIPPTHSMADGSVHTSRKSLRSTYKPSGNKQGKRYHEVADGKFAEPPKRERPSAEDDVREAIRQLKWNEAPLTEYDRHRCAVINRNLEHYNYDRRRGDDE